MKVRFRHRGFFLCFAGLYALATLPAHALEPLVITTSSRAFNGQLDPLLDMIEGNLQRVEEASCTSEYLDTQKKLRIFLLSSSLVGVVGSGLVAIRLALLQRPNEAIPFFVVELGCIGGAFLVREVGAFNLIDLHLLFKDRNGTQVLEYRIEGLHRGKELEAVKELLWTYQIIVSEDQPEESKVHKPSLSVDLR